MKEEVRSVVSNRGKNNEYKFSWNFIQDLPFSVKQIQEYLQKIYLATNKKLLTMSSPFIDTLWNLWQRCSLGTVMPKLLCLCSPAQRIIMPGEGINQWGANDSENVGALSTEGLKSKLKISIVSTEATTAL